MNAKNQKTKDEIYKKMYEKSLSTQSFLAALKANLDHETAFKIAKDAFSRYMVKIYADVLKGTDENSIERFDKFRAFYEEYAKKTPYLEIIESTKTKLKVKYTRCPFYEVLVDEKLEDLAYTFCLSDSVFTAKVLPGVKFSREKEIVRNDKYCDHTWEFIKK